MSPHRSRVVVLSLMSLLSGFTEAFFLVVVTRIALTVAEGNERVGIVLRLDLPLPGAVGLACGLVLLRLVLGLLATIASTSLTASVVLDVRSRLSKAYLGSSWAVQQSQASGRLQQLVVGSAGRSADVVSYFSYIVVGGLNLAALVVVSIVVDPVATVAIAGALSVLGLAMAPIRRRIRIRGVVTAKAAMELGKTVEELGSLGLEMQTFGVRRQFEERLQERSEREVRAQQRSGIMNGWLPVVYSSLAYLALVAGLGMAAAVDSQGLSAIGAVMLVMLRSLGYGQQVQTGIGLLVNAFPFLEQADQAIDEYERNRAAGHDALPSEVTPIVFDQVSFSYRPDQPVLKDVSFQIEPGEVIGLIGPSGAGKTTLVQLLLGLRDPVLGRVTVGGVDLATVDRAWWTRRTSFVPQVPVLFTGTVAENLRFFRGDIDEAQLHSAARMAHIDETVRQLPDGYDEHLGERGSKLSGGQRQRMSIARALAGSPSLLVLDEPTSALDVESESLIKAALLDLRGSVTVVIVAHRMSTLDMCDRLMVVDDGRITAFDSPEGLRRDSEFYRRALEMSGLA